jgi:putative MATE family efflux protein
LKKLGPWQFYRHALTIALPVILQQFLLNAVSLIDNFMVAGLGDASMAAVNVANQLNFVYLILLGTISGAGGIFLAQYKGANQTEGMQHAYRFKVIFSIIASVGYFAICQLFPEAMMSLMTNGNTEQSILVQKGAEYLRVVSWSFLPLSWISAGASSLRDIGKTLPPLIFSITAALVNTSLNFLLIGGNLGFPRMEVEGAALATVLSRIVEFIVLFIWFLRNKPAFKVPIASIFLIDTRILVNILSKSWMILVSELTWIVSETIISALYNGRGGADLVAGLAAGWTIANLFFSVFGGLHVATAVIVGSSLGSGALDEARTKAHWILRGSWILGTLFALLQISTLLLIPLVFSNLSADALKIARSMLLVITLYLPLWVYINAQFAVSRAGGDTLMGFLVDIIATLGLFLPGAFLLAFLTDLDAVSIFAIIKLSDFAKLGIAHWWLLKEKWVQNVTAP